MTFILIILFSPLLLFPLIAFMFITIIVFYLQFGFTILAV